MRSSETGVSDAALRDAIRRAEPRTVNGEPDAHQIAEHCDLTPGVVLRRARRLADRGEVAIHESVVVGESGVVKTITLEGDA